MPALQQQAARTAKTLRVSSARVQGVMWPNEFWLGFFQLGYSEISGSYLLLPVLLPPYSVNSALNLKSAVQLHLT